MKLDIPVSYFFLKSIDAKDNPLFFRNSQTVTNGTFTTTIADFLSKLETSHKQRPLQLVLSSL